jgi:hypothetical protein
LVIICREKEPLDLPENASLDDHQTMSDYPDVALTAKRDSANSRKE